MITKTHTRRKFFGAVVTVALLATPIVAADWLQWGGPRGDFTVDSPKLADGWPETGPPTLWKRPLGEGYSSILAKDGVLYTTYRKDDREIIVALDAQTGETRWEFKQETDLWSDMTHAFGRGPNATPLIVGDRLVSVSIDGQLRCLDLRSGTLLWQHDLPAEYGRRARDEEYGYSASPMLFEGRVIVLVGGDDHGVVAFNPADGSPVWKSAATGVSYAATTLTTLGGKKQFIYFSPQGVVGLDPSDGTTLWDSPMEYNNGNHLTPIVKCDETHIWVGSQFPTGGGRLLEIEQVEGGWTATRVWFETYLRASHWTNIRLGDFIYGSTGGNSTSVLTAFNWKTGKIAWRKRGFHKAQALYADGKLIFLDEGGQLALTRVSPDGLELLASTEVTESVSWSLPSLVGTKLYLRDQTDILALELGDTGKSYRPSEASVSTALDPEALLGDFGKFVLQVSQAQNKTALIDAFMAKQSTFPIVEGDSLVHFVYRGEVPDIALSGNFVQYGNTEPLHPLPQTDLYFRSYRLAPSAHFEYRFHIFDDRLADPRNAKRLTADDDAPSIVTTGGWKEPQHLSEPTGKRGQLDRFNWESSTLDNEREIKIYTPAGYGESKQRYPLLLVNYGDQALAEGRWAQTLDNLIGKSVAPLVAVFIPTASFNEYGADVANFADAIAQELVPYVEKNYRILPGAANRAMAGIASGGFATAFSTLHHPEVLGAAAVQSFYFRRETQEQLRAMIAKADSTAGSFFVEWSSYDLDDGQNLRCERDSRELAELLEQRGVRLTTHQSADGAGWGGWRAGNRRILEQLFPRE